MSIFNRIAEQRIKEAMERGEFDNLEGKGKPQDLSAYERLPEDLRMAYTILKNAGCKPPELELKNEILRMEDLLAGMTDEREKYRQIQKLNFLVTKLNLMRNTRVDFEESQRYYGKLLDKIKTTDKNPDRYNVPLNPSFRPSRHRRSTGRSPRRWRAGRTRAWPR